MVFVSIFSVELPGVRPVFCGQAVVSVGTMAAIHPGGVVRFVVIGGGVGA